MIKEEKRRRTRVSVHFDATFEVNGIFTSLETENISLNGMLCKPGSRLKTGERGRVQITLSPEAVIMAEAKVVRSDLRGLAVAFLDINPKGFFHLKKLVQYNTEDADLIDRELSNAGFNAG